MFTKPFEKRLERKSRKKVRSMSIQLFSTFLKKGLSKKAGKRHGKCLFIGHRLRNSLAADLDFNKKSSPNFERLN